MDKIIAVVYLHGRDVEYDVEIPLDITAIDLILGLNEGLKLGMDTSNPYKLCLKAENPVALLMGDRPLAEFGLRNGVSIHYTD